MNQGPVAIFKVFVCVSTSETVSALSILSIYCVHREFWKKKNLEKIQFVVFRFHGLPKILYSSINHSLKACVGSTTLST